MEGLYALDQIDEMLAVVISDFQTDETVGQDLLTFCANRKDKFAIITVPEGMGYQEATNWRKRTLDQYSKYGAVYYPHIKIIDPVTDQTLNLPVGGHVAGVFARTDRERNIGKAPAGAQDGALRFLVGLETSLTRDQVGHLTQNKVNALIDWTNVGQSVWGARTHEITGGEYPYIQQIRTMMFAKKSIYNSTHIHVFETNGPALWNKIRLQVGTFLRTLWTRGILAGNTPAEAFFVVCDETNNPPAVVNSGELYCDVGLATTRPAEFITFRFQQIVEG